jgi:hypothetical protein
VTTAIFRGRDEYREDDQGRREITDEDLIRVIKRTKGGYSDMEKAVRHVRAWLRGAGDLGAVA